MGWPRGWRLGEENVVFGLPRADVMRVSGSAERALVTFRRWSRQSDAGGGWPEGAG